ncbi:MAG: helix-turn-helix domain containing protein [Novosphingobium sp.]|nr:helix-turn-helix domain containing protein [Novosphingobium sp.]
MQTSSDPKLGIEQIVDQALELLREEGMDKLSMRRLAARVGIRAPSLYYYFPDKAALMAAMMERLFGRCLDAIPPTDDWRRWMHGFGRAIWEVQDIYPFTGELITASMLDAEYFRRTTARLQATLARFGEDVDVLMRLQSSVQALMTGWSTFAHARYAGQLGQMFDVEAVAFDSLDALIKGWAKDEA